MYIEREGLAYLRKTFPKTGEANMKEGIFVGPQITHLFKDQDVSMKLDST